uniref:Uncharacterized protein n=1 Tax=Trypanosoma congolense (strain IL3000) TaxID=1068625 RepID=G0UTV3_TRYCI|nr:conserved hypothetical protein [Trypanosoma congolense IL3000]
MCFPFLPCCLINHNCYSLHNVIQVSVQRVGRILSQRALCKFMSYLISPRRSPEGEEEEGRCEDDVGVVGTSRVVEDDSNPPPQPHPSPGCSGPTYHFISKPLFAVPCDSVTAGDTGGSGCCDTLITILVDSKHVLVITDCHKKSTDTRSVFYVVQLHAQGQDIYGRSLLPIAKPSGCVQDESKFNVLQPLQEEAAEFVDPSFDNVEGQHSTERSSRLISPLDDSMSNGSLSYDDETTQCAVAGGSNAPMHANLPHRQLTNVCLVADAVSHAIWAVDVDVKSLKVEVVLPCCYWGGSGGHEETQAITHERHEQGLDFTSKKAAILGGDRGFVDGTFEAARFNTPCALCWNTSTYDAGKGTHDDKKRVMGSSILFVSDWGNSALRQVDFVSRMVRTIVGIDGVPGYRDGAYAASQLQRAAVLLWSSAGLLFVDEPNNAVRLLARVSKMEDANDTSEIKEPPPLASVMENDESINAFRGSRRVPESGEVVAPVTSSHMQIFTVAGGLRSGSKIEDDVSDVIRSNLGTSSAAALAPDGSGVLFVDGHSGSLRLLSSHGVKTLVDSKLSTDTLSVSSCLVGCTHILACTLSLHPGDRPRSAFLVSSTTRHAVSLLILCDGSMENDVLSAGADLPAEALLTPARLPRLRKGTLRKYKRTAKKSVHMCDSKANGTIRSPRNDADEALCGTNKLLDYSAHCSKENDSRPSVNEKRGSPLCNPVSLQESSSVRPDLTVRLEEAAAGVFDIYLRYARRFVPQHMRLVACPTSCKHHPHDPMYTCSLSLIGFWRLITHAGYFATCPALVSSLFPFPRVDKPPALRLKEGKCNDLLYLNLYDWRVVLELIYGWSVRRHGHHIVSLMCPDYFFRVIVLLYRCKESWKERQDGGEQDAGGDGVGVGVLRCDWHAASTSLESVSDEEVFAAYDDFTRRIREVRLLLRRSEGLPADGHVSTGSHQQPDTIDRGEEVKLLGDDVLQLLMLNECALRQLFESYSRSTTLTTRSTTWCDSSRRGVTVMLRLKQILSGGREHSFASTDRVNGMPYTEFRRLFFMIGVFPTLITEPLLQRAFVDALQTPLFCRIRMNPVDGTTKHEEKQALSTNDSTAKGPTEMTLLRQDAAERRKSSSHNDKRSVRQNAELSFLVFVEAFTRVALTVFSQCPEHDTREYPTAAAKVHALMCWINRSIELNLTREGDIMHHLGPYINNTTSHQYIVQYSQRPFPFFNISTTKSFSNSHENNDQHDKSSRNENNESTKSMGVSI